jgi:hypothetical protein
MASGVYFPRPSCYNYLISKNDNVKEIKMKNDPMVQAIADTDELLGLLNETCTTDEVWVKDSECSLRFRDGDTTLRLNVYLGRLHKMEGSRVVSTVNISSTATIDQILKQVAKIAR